MSSFENWYVNYVSDTSYIFNKIENKYIDSNTQIAYEAFCAGMDHQKSAGYILPKKNTLVYGVGVNDADYAVTRSEVVDGKRKTIWCPFYKVWVNMMKRCYNEKSQVAMPTYKKASVAAVWHRFSAFKAWMEKQYYVGLELDKELLSNGGKVYSPETCCFISRKVNSIVLINEKSRGEFPIGVLQSTGGKYRSMCSVDAKNTHLGTYESAIAAHGAWQTAKAGAISLLAEHYKLEPYYRLDVYNQLIKISTKLLSERDEGKETVSMWI